MSKTVWLGRKAESEWYEIGRRKSDWYNPIAGFSHERVDSFCPKDFERITGFKLEPGEVCKVRITVERV